MHSLGAGSFTNPTVQSVVRSVVIYMVLEASKNNGKIMRKDSEAKVQYMATKSASQSASDARVP